MQNCKSAPLEMGTATAHSVLRQAVVVVCSPCLGLGLRLGVWGFLPLGEGSPMVLVMLENLQMCVFVGCPSQGSVATKFPVPPCILCHPPSRAILHPIPSSIPCHPPSHTASLVPSIPPHPSPGLGAVAGNHGVVAGGSAVPCQPGADGNELTEHRQH